MKMDRWYMVTVVGADHSTRKCKTRHPLIALQTMIRSPSDTVTISPINENTRGAQRRDVTATVTGRPSRL